MSTGDVRVDKRVGLQGRGEGSVGLVLIPDLTPRKCGQAHDLVGNKDKFSYGKSNAPL